MNKQQADLFKQGTLELLILRLLNSGSLNGWDIMQRIEVLSGDVLTITAGALYPALHRLESRGLISAVWRPSASFPIWERVSASRRSIWNCAGRGTCWADSNRAIWMRSGLIFTHRC